MQNEAVLWRATSMDYDDARAECLLLAVQSWPKWDGTKSAWPTFLRLRLRNRFRDMLRGQQRGKRRATAVSIDLDSVPQSTESRASLPPEMVQQIHDILETVDDGKRKAVLRWMQGAKHLRTKAEKILRDAVALSRRSSGEIL